MIHDLATGGDLATPALRDLGYVDLAHSLATWSWQGASFVDGMQKCYLDSSLGEFRAHSWAGGGGQMSLLEIFFSSQPTTGSYACVDSDSIGFVMAGQAKVFVSGQSGGSLTDYHCTGGTVEVDDGGSSIVMTMSALPMRVKQGAAVADTLTATLPCP